jgi:hypothetical protein
MATAIRMMSVLSESAGGGDAFSDDGGLIT